MRQKSRKRYVPTLRAATALKYTGAALTSLNAYDSTKQALETLDKGWSTGCLNTGTSEE